MQKSNQDMNDWIRQAAGIVPAPGPTEGENAPGATSEGEPAAAKIPQGNAGSGASQRGVFSSKPTMNQIIRAMANRGGL